MGRKLNNPRGFLNIRAVSEETGISPATLRIWEMRYGWPKPERRGNGYRAYSADLVVELKRLSEMLELGYQIGELLWGGEVHWPGEDVENPHQGASREVSVAECLPEPRTSKAQNMRRDVLAALESRAVNRMHEFLQRADWELRADDIPLAVMAPWPLVFASKMFRRMILLPQIGRFLTLSLITDSDWCVVCLQMVKPSFFNLVMIIINA